MRAFPHVQLDRGLQIGYVGMFCPDAMFRAFTRTGSFHHRVPGEDISPAAPVGAPTGESEVPEWMLLSSERVVENLEPPEHARARLPAVSRTAAMRNQFLTYAYGRPSVLHAPRHVATDSQQRLVLSDPAGSAVHVIDPRGRTSMRLVAGAGYRLHTPAGVAVDANDNLYVADSEQGVVVVFDRSGNFVRYIGNYQGEPQYESPRGIAIETTTQHLFLVDTPRNLIFVMDLEGRVLGRLGRDRRSRGEGQFEAPTEIAVNRQHIFILDRWGTRIQVWDLNLKPLGDFTVPGGVEPGRLWDNGLSVDQAGRVYVSLFRYSVVGMFSTEGSLISFFGQAGTRAGEFAGPAGLWIDPQNRLYVSDSGNGRVQMFQLNTAK
jgi:DNA-binding beta-propeller fold protein YncE